MKDYTVTKEIKLTDSKREEFLEHDKKIVMLKMQIAGLTTQLHDLQEELDRQIGDVKKSAQEYHSLIENTAKELGLDMDKKWAFNTVELKYILEEPVEEPASEPEVEAKTDE